MRAGYSGNKLQDLSNYGEADETGINPNHHIEETEATQNEAKAMYASVAKNGGFYIGRYETGKETTNLEDGSTSTKAVVKKEAPLYNYVTWGDTVVLPGDGAVEIARNFAESYNHDTKQVQSTLCYSIQWDSALSFIDPTYTGYAKDSTKQGWFSDNYNSTSTGNTATNPTLITGKDLIYKNTPNTISNMHKNIYDLGGNAREWVMEAYGAASRGVRGGYYKYSGSARPASNRTYGNPYDCLAYIGFRITLYIVPTDVE